LRTPHLPLTAVMVGLTSLVAVDLGSSQPAQAASEFLCPETHAATTNAALQETPEQLASATNALKSPELGNAIRVIAGDLRKKYPNAGTADIVNYMLTAYCPLVAAKGGLGADEKQAEMDRFSSQVFQILKE
jgi:hypothetical protein